MDVPMALLGAGTEMTWSRWSSRVREVGFSFLGEIVEFVKDTLYPQKLKTNYFNIIVTSLLNEWSKVSVVADRDVSCEL